MFIALAKNAHNLTGRRFGRLLALGPIERRRSAKTSSIVWLCRCECGKETKAYSANLTHGRTKSCGCSIGESVHIAKTVHGGANAGKHTPEYRVWTHMKSRCGNPRVPSFKYYGARGIEVCDRWLDFANFLADMGSRPTNKHSIDRIDYDRGYEPANCRWATATEQVRNRRIAALLTVNGETRHAMEWAEITGIAYGTIMARLKVGWSEEDAVLRPLVYNRGQPTPRPELYKRRDHAVRRATPKWLTPRQRLEMRELKALAQISGQTLDHIEPIQGRLVSGLHVPWNLRLVTRVENQRKSNRQLHSGG